MKIQINNYKPEVFEFVKLYLQYWENKWMGIPEHWFVEHGLVSDEFLKNLNHGDLDSNEYNIVFNWAHFDVTECLIIQRYYYKNYDHDHYRNQYIIDNTNWGRMYREAGLKRPTSRRTSYRGGKKSSSRRIKKRTTRTRTRTMTRTRTRTRPRTRKCHLLL